MVIVERKKFANISTLHVVKKNACEDKLPLLIFWHGFTSAKEHNLHYAYSLAEEGFRVILPDAIHHGERDEGLTDSQRELVFWDIVIQSITDTKHIAWYTAEEYSADHKNVAMAGVSMGAIITLGSLTQYDWVTVAGSLMGTPAYSEFALQQINSLKLDERTVPFSEEELMQKVLQLKPYDLSSKPDNILGRQLFFWHGERDAVVPVTGVKEFADQFSDRDNLKLIIDSQAGHQVNPEGLLSFISWMKKQRIAMSNIS